MKQQIARALRRLANRFDPPQRATFTVYSTNPTTATSTGTTTVIDWKRP